MIRATVILASLLSLIIASSASAATPPQNTNPPTISGNTVQGSTLTAYDGTWTGDQPITITRQWKRCDTAGANCVNIGATNTTYTLVIADVGSTIKLRVTATNSAGSTVKNTAATAVVTASNSGGSPVYFSASSPFNAVIPASPILDSNSAAIVARLSSGSTGRFANLYAYGIPIYTATGTETRYQVTCLEPWGTCPFIAHPAPLRSTYIPSSGTDVAMVVVDSAAHTAFEFWQYAWNSGSPRTSWGDVCDTNSLGTVTTPPDAVGGDCNGVGAGVSRLAGVILKNEIANGFIPHALAFSSNKTCPNSNYRYPAQKSDGSNSGYVNSDCIPEGTRVQLNPSVDCNAQPNITVGEKALCVALKTYGAYAIDVAGGTASMAFIFEDPNGVTGGDAAYNAAGLTIDGFALSHIPWTQLRVLRQWDGL